MIRMNTEGIGGMRWLGLLNMLAHGLSGRFFSSLP